MTRSLMHPGMTGRALMLILSALAVAVFTGAAHAQDNATSDTVVPTDPAQASFDCLIEPTVVSQVGSHVQGVVEKLLVERGDTVKAGQPIARLEASLQTISGQKCQISFAISDRDLAVGR